MPATAAPILLSGYVFLAAWGLVNLHGRRRRRLYVSQWFLLITLVWFPWVFSTAMVLLLFFPVRGVMQTIVSGWYAHNLFELCLTSVGLAIIFYFLPKLLNRPLHSRGLALFGYWVLVFFGGWGGLHRGEPVPNWLSGVSGVAQVFVLLAVLAFGLSWFRTLRDSLGRMQSDGVLRFIGIGMVSYILAAVLKAVAALPGVSEVTDFTLFTQGLAQLQIHGFLIMTLAGAVYYAGPRLAGCAWPTPGLMKVHFWSAAAGVVVMSVALLIGGILQGMGIAQPQTDFTTIARRMVPFLGTATLGTMLLLIGYGAFLLNLVRLLLACCPCAAVWERVRPQVAAAGLIGRAGS
jgi:cytochrome c oxidase cbb3-type subunit 1